MKKIELIDDFSPRTYQQTIFANSINKNSLVVLPTGLGKTVIAMMLTIYYYNKDNKKILFLGPTRPLVEQQKKSFEKFFKNRDDFKFQTLTGQISPAKRVQLYKDTDFIFSTPQLIENDIINKTINLSDFSLIVIDEAHRATGNYAYNFIAQEAAKTNSKILALTASPGTSKEEITNIINNLKIEVIEVKKYDDYDVKPYVFQTKIENIKIELPEEFKQIKKHLDNAYNKRVKLLKDLNFLKGINSPTKRDLLDLQTHLRLMITQGDSTEDIWKAISVSAALLKLSYGIELFESQEVSAAHIYFFNFFRAGGDNTKAAQDLLIDIDFREAFDKISKLTKNKVLHPKLIKLKDIVNDEINKNPNLKIIIFNQYRETAQKLVEELSQIREIKPALFVGQAKKGDVKLTQKDQKKIIEDFRDDKYNIIVSTSVGEEGLDIPKVDLVIFYEPVASAIRTIQRIGRTGRFKQGKAYILITQGTRDVITKHIASAKEKKMYKVLDEIKDESGPENKDKNDGLKKFLVENKEQNQNLKLEHEIKQENQIKSKTNLPKIYIDNRENNDLIKELYKLDEIEIESKKLEVADIVITDEIAIERKAKIDFVNSIIDKRLFEQLINLAKNYRRPILILEGNENLFTLRNINPNVIRSTLSAIAIELRMPIIYTTDIKETAQMILTITKRTQKEKKDISLATNKTSHSENEELEKVISTIPKINVVTAKTLLQNYKTIKDLINTNEKQLTTIEGIGKIRAKSLINFFEREYKQ